MMRIIYHRLFAVCISLPLLTSCAQQKNKPVIVAQDTAAVYPQKNIIPLSEKERLRLNTGVGLFYDSLLKSGSFNGGVLVAKGGNIVFEKYKGLIDPAGKDPVTAETSMHVASVSKTFTAMAILKMQEQGKLSVDDAVSKYIPDFNYPGVTIKTLLNHRSGLPNYNHFFEKTKWSKDSVLTNNDVLRYLIDHKSELENIGTPDRAFTYCNTNYAVLASIIEKVSGMAYPAFMQKNVFVPLKLEHTFVRSKGDNKIVTKSFDWKGREIPDNYLDMVYGDKNIYTTPQDLLRWDRALSDTIFLSAKSLEAAYIPYSNEKPGIKNYGLGWHMNIYPDGKKIIFHNGWWHGSNAAFIRLLKDDATIIVIGNQSARVVYKAKYLVNLFDSYFNRDVEDAEPAGEKITANDSSVVKRKLPLKTTRHRYKKGK